MVGIKDIAKAAGVSVSTVSNVLNGKKNVGEETRERILNICKEMSYYPNTAGKALKSGKSNTILFNFSDFDRSFYLKIINGISDYVNDNEFDLIICTEKSCEKYMRSNLTGGSIILDKKMKDEVLIKIASEHYPIVVLDRVIDNPYIKSVVVNNYDPMREMIQGLVDRGYRHFGFVGGPEQTADNKERYKAFRDVLEENNISFQQKSYFAGDYREKSGYTAAKILLLSQEIPDCLVCANDNMAIGAMKAFRDNGIRVPEDIAVTGFDNCDLAEAMELTTVSIPNYERGYIAARYLIENIRGKRNVEPFKISAKIKWRGSVAVKK
ncbi:MAG: transcriptional regulator [Anaerocolumna sp.]|jgi:LacI family transcriptional regulator|nr:transcriptional regulator [Anaerocolumna sp.]